MPLPLQARRTLTVWSREYRWARASKVARSEHNRLLPRSERKARKAYRSPPMTVLSMIATEDARGERLDRELARNFADFSRARLQALIREGAVRLGEIATTDLSLKLRGGEKITL